MKSYGQETIDQIKRDVKRSEVGLFEIDIGKIAQAVTRAEFYGCSLEVIKFMIKEPSALIPLLARIPVSHVEHRVRPIIPLEKVHACPADAAPEIERILRRYPLEVFVNVIHFRHVGKQRKIAIRLKLDTPLHVIGEDNVHIL